MILLPVPLIVPPVLLQVTAVFVALLTVALKLCAAPLFMLSESGEMATLTWPGRGLTLILELALIVTFAWLVAVAV